MSRKCQIAIKVSKCYESHSLTNLRPCLSTYHGVESVPYWRLLRAATGVWRSVERCVLQCSLCSTLMSAEIATDSSLTDTGAGEYCCFFCI